MKYRCQAKLWSGAVRHSSVSTSD